MSSEYGICPNTALDAHLTDVISMEFQQRCKLSLLEFDEDSSNHNEILYISREHSCMGMAQFSCFQIQIRQKYIHLKEDQHFLSGMDARN